MNKINNFDGSDESQHLATKTGITSIVSLMNGIITGICSHSTLGNKKGTNNSISSRYLSGE